MDQDYLFDGSKLIGHFDTSGAYLKLCPKCQKLPIKIYARKGMCDKCGLDCNAELLKNNQVDYAT